MPWKVIAVSFLAFGSGWCLSDLENQCIRDFNKDFNNDLLQGTWYHVLHLTLFGVTIPSSECPTFVYSKPNSTELERYKAEYLKPDIPYSFNDNPVHQDGGPRRSAGLTIGNTEAKFFVMDPNTTFFRTQFTLRIYQQLRDDLILFQDCYSRGNMRWLMSRNKNPSQEEVEAIVNSYPELAKLILQWYCV